MPRTKRDTTTKSNGAPLGFEEKLWAAADKMRGHMDAAEYKHVVLGLVFLKYISDAFEERHVYLLKEAANPKSDLYVREERARYTVAEDRDEYKAENVFWVPKQARWSYLQANAKQPTIGKLIDEAMIAIEKENPSLKGVLSKDYARPALDKQRLGELIDLIGTIGLGDQASRSKEVLGRVYEYFLGRFASAEGKGGGEFYTPQSVVKLLVEMIEPYKGRVYDPCCGSGGMFVQSEKFVLAHGGRIGDLAIYGQESNPTTWRLCKMNLAIRGIDGNIGDVNADTFHTDLHKDLRADFILANPPFNVSDWGGERLRDDVRWKYGGPPSGIALYAEIAAGLPAIAGDGDRLGQVFSNLIDNALKHTPSGGKVTVAARTISGSSAVKRGKPLSGVEISVADTGSGISHEDLSRIFERFYQVDKSRVKSKAGSLGLGLAIVKEIITAHGGTIHAESIVGLGTKFVVWLPLERAKV